MLSRYFIMNVHPFLSFVENPPTNVPLIKPRQEQTMENCFQEAQMTFQCSNLYHSTKLSQKYLPERYFRGSIRKTKNMENVFSPILLLKVNKILGVQVWRIFFLFLLRPELCFHKCACQLDSPDDVDVRFERGLGHLPCLEM